MKITRFFKSAVSVILLSGLLSSAFACAPAGVSAEDLMKDVTPSAGTTQTADKKITETVDFAVKLMQTAEEEGKNTLLSPLSVLAALAMITKTELALILIGGIFVIETLCVIIQQVSVRTIHKRVFIYTPIHYAFRIKGMQETHIVAMFWIVEAVFATIGLWICLH